ncbi:hypothetical protein KY320_01430 [Candidatus Woesearchaeota archaeon]|nr:hypothetical protein [Candidatus Woesearchaeota archaeon]
MGEYEEMGDFILDHIYIDDVNTEDDLRELVDMLYESEKARLADDDKDTSRAENLKKFVNERWWDSSKYPSNKFRDRFTRLERIEAEEAEVEEREIFTETLADIEASIRTRDYEQALAIEIPEEATRQQKAQIGSRKAYAEKLLERRQEYENLMDNPEAATWARSAAHIKTQLDVNQAEADRLWKKIQAARQK